jgi:hypothetical protein
LKIHEKSGEIYVDANQTIDCDIPVRESIECTINISDGELEDSKNVKHLIIFEKKN